MKRPLLMVLTGAWLGSAACAGPAFTPDPAPAAAPRPIGAETITAADVYARVAFLASDALRGRDTPSEGLDAAAAYLVSEYLRLGLAPAGENGTFYQWYPFPQLSLDTTSVHFGTLVGGVDNRSLAYGSDFYVQGVLPPRGARGGDMNHGRIAYVGELGAEGLPGGSYRGAVPMVTVPGGYDRAWRASVSQARRLAAAAGSAAVIVVAALEFPAETFRARAAASHAADRQIPVEGEIAVVHLTHEAAASIAARAGQALDRLPRKVSAPIELTGVEAHFTASLRMLDQRTAPNVVAVLPGSDPVLRDEYVVLSAHMDHVGVGTPVDGDSIYNGADDDASGTAALVEIAEALASLPVRPRRSVIFLHVSGEEHGLLGSRWYSDHPTVPLGRIVANINVDMIGRNAPDSVVVIGKDYSSLGRVVSEVGAHHPELDLVVADDLWPEQRFFFRSDHFNFARKEIPAIFFFTGVHEDYHRPSDEVEKLNVGKAARISRLMYHVLLAIANDPQRPAWDPKGLEQVRALTR